MLQTLTYSKFALAHADFESLATMELEPFATCPGSMFRWKVLLSEPACQVVLEDWFKDNDIEWTYWIDTLMYVVGGEAEITIWQPPNWVKRHVVVARAGDVFLCPRGARTWFKVLSQEPFRRLVIDMPNPGFDAEELAAGTAGDGRTS